MLMTIIIVLSMTYFNLGHLCDSLTTEVILSTLIVARLNITNSSYNSDMIVLHRARGLYERSAGAKMACVIRRKELEQTQTWRHDYWCVL